MSGYVEQVGAASGDHVVRAFISGLPRWGGADRTGGESPLLTVIYLSKRMVTSLTVFLPVTVMTSRGRGVRAGAIAAGVRKLEESR